MSWAEMRKFVEPVGGFPVLGGYQIFTSSNIFNIPKGVTVVAIAASGVGGSCTGAGGGGAAGACKNLSIDVTGINQLSIACNVAGSRSTTISGDDNLLLTLEGGSDGNGRTGGAGGSCIINNPDRIPYTQLGGTSALAGGTGGTARYSDRICGSGGSVFGVNGSDGGQTGTFQGSPGGKGLFADGSANTGATGGSGGLGGGGGGGSDVGESSSFSKGGPGMVVIWWGPVTFNDIAEKYGWTTQ